MNKPSRSSTAMSDVLYSRLSPKVRDCPLEVVHMAMTLPSPIYGEHLLMHDKSATAATGATYPLYGAYTPTTATLTPTRMRSIKQEFEQEEELEETSYIAKHRPRRYQHQAGFVIPNVNFSLYMKPNKHLLQEFHLQQQQQQQQIDSAGVPPLELAGSKSELCSSNSNDSFRFSEGYSSDHTSSSNIDNLSMSQANKMAGKRQTALKNQNNDTLEHPATRSHASNRRQPKKSNNSGGRRPGRSDHLTPEEEAKREKRRERNKQAAARCRKRRLDQTNGLMDETNDMVKENEELIAKVKILAEEYQNIRGRLCMHESKCEHSFKFTSQMELIDYEQLHELMAIIPDEGGDMLDDNASVSSRNSTTRCSSATMDQGDASRDSSQFSSYDTSVANSGNNITTIVSTSAPSSAKRTRPNTLSVSKSYNPTNQTTTTTTATSFAANQIDSSASAANQTDSFVITPTNGILFENTPNGNFMPTPILGQDWAPITPSTVARLLGS